MAATKHFGHVELQSPHLGVVCSLQAVWMLLKHQRRYRRNLSDLLRFDSRLLRDIGLEPPRDLHWKDRRMASSPPRRSEGWKAKRSEQEALSGTGHAEQQAAFTG